MSDERPDGRKAVSIKALRGKISDDGTTIHEEEVVLTENDPLYWMEVADAEDSHDNPDQGKEVLGE
jgi:hypothetical protein